MLAPVLTHFFRASALHRDVHAGIDKVLTVCCSMMGAGMGTWKQKIKRRSMMLLALKK